MPLRTPLALRPGAPGPRVRPADGQPRRRDRGSVTLELAILFPVLLSLTFGAIQVGLWYSARTMCQAAAEAGARAAKVHNAPAGAGAAAANGYLSAVAGGLVVGPAVTEGRTATTVNVRCVGQAQNVLPLPGLSIGVEQSATAGIERFSTR